MGVVVADVDIAFVDLHFMCLGLAHVQLDREMSCGTSRWTWTFKLVTLQFDALFWQTAYAIVECPLWHHIGHKCFLQCGVDKT